VQNVAEFLSNYTARNNVCLEQVPDYVMLISLCLAREWEITKSTQDRSSVLKRLKTVLYHYEETKIKTTDSNIETKLEQSPDSEKFISIKASDSILKPILQTMDSACKEILSDHVLRRLTEEFNKNIKTYLPFIDKYEDLVPKEIRENITVEIVILDLSLSQLKNYPVNDKLKFDLWAFTNTKNVQREGKNIRYATIAIPYDLAKHTNIINVLEHEINHAYGGLTHGHYYSCARGTDEAMTEYMTLYPTAYSSQRDVLDIIFSQYPELRNIFIKAYFDRSKRDELTKSIFNRYGTEGVIHIEFMTHENKIQYNRYTQSTLIDPNDSAAFFNKFSTNQNTETSNSNQENNTKLEREMEELKQELGNIFLRASAHIHKMYEADRENALRLRSEKKKYESSVKDILQTKDRKYKVPMVLTNFIKEVKSGDDEKYKNIEENLSQEDKTVFENYFLICQQDQQQFSSVEGRQKTSSIANLYFALISDIATHISHIKAVTKSQFTIDQLMNKKDLQNLITLFNNVIEVNDTTDINTLESYEQQLKIIEEFIEVVRYNIKSSSDSLLLSLTTNPDIKYPNMFSNWRFNKMIQDKIRTT
jgi:hypothetical protein